MPIFGHKQRLVLNKTVKQVSTNSVNPSSPQSRVLRNIFTFNSTVVTTITMSHLTLHKVTGALLFLPNINISYVMENLEVTIKVNPVKAAFLDSSL